MANTTLREVPPSLTTGVISLTDTGDLIAAVTSKKILVWRIFIQSADATKTLTIKNGSTALTGAMAVSQLSLSAPIVPGLPGATAVPIFETSAGNALTVTASAGVGIAGWAVYSTE